MILLSFNNLGCFFDPPRLHHPRRSPLIFNGFFRFWPVQAEWIHVLSVALQARSSQTVAACKS